MKAPIAAYLESGHTSELIRELSLYIQEENEKYVHHLGNVCTNFAEHPKAKFINIPQIIQYIFSYPGKIGREDAISWRNFVATNSTSSLFLCMSSVATLVGSTS